MPDETELRGMLRDGASGSGGLDADRIIRLSKRRRRPRVIAAGALGSLAAVAIVVPVAIGIGGGVSPAGSPVADGAESSAEESREMGAADDGAAGATTLETETAIGMCGHAAPAFGSDPGGLDLHIVGILLAEDGTPTGLEYELTNTGAMTIRGLTAASVDAALVTADGVAALSTPAGEDGKQLALDPGESSRYTVDIDASSCGGLTASEYTATAWITLYPENGTSPRVIGSQPSHPIWVRTPPAP